MLLKSICYEICMYHAYTCMYVYVCMYVCVCMYTYIDKSCTKPQIEVCMYVCMCVCVCVCAFVLVCCAQSGATYRTTWLTLVELPKSLVGGVAVQRIQAYAQRILFLFLVAPGVPTSNHLFLVS
jgi:hypothetical protein